VVAALRGSTAAGVRGEREREVRRSYSPPYLEQRWCKERLRGGWQGAAAMALGGSAGELARELAAAVRFVVVKGDAGGSFIGKMRRWSGGGRWAGERCGAHW
jgi:hypothetical protein